MYRQIPNNTSLGNTEEENTTHIYDEVKSFSVNCSKATDDESGLNYEVVFDTANNCQQPPIYHLTPTKTIYNDCKLQHSKCNDYYIRDEVMHLNKENCHTSSKNQA